MLEKILYLWYTLIKVINGRGDSYGKSTRIDRSKCPDPVRYVGTHVAMIFRGNNGNYYWDYQAVKNAFDHWFWDFCFKGIGKS